ncbi:DUF2934 domain-containing protein [Bradyrhizobium sp. ISRA443]|uniref:DUF2934 domain-containing protein n=1 Tax=unclassified Bradyrhizobium TaxID=2631580 RepID=UPI0032AF3097
MTGPTEQEIRTRAYELWKAAGEPRCKMDVLWYQAEKELLSRKSGNGDVSPAERRKEVPRQAGHWGKSSKRRAVQHRS